MNKNILAIGITILFLGVVVTPMTLGYDGSIPEKEIVTEVSGLLIADDNTHYMGDSRGDDCTEFLDTVDSSEILFSNGKIAYAVIVDSGSSGKLGPCYFALDDPGDINSLCSSEKIYSGGTWTTDDRWLACNYFSGELFEIDPEDGGVTSIGGGGMGCHGLAWDPVYNKLYGTTGSHLIEYNPNNGEQTVIGNHGINQTLIALAINLKGVCYAWDVKFEGNAILYTIDLESGEATEVGDMGMNLVYAQDGAFDWGNNILYLSAYNKNTKGFLATCDVDTAELTVIADFEGGAELDALAIPYDWSGVPHADFTWTPTLPNPDEMIIFNASKSIDPDGYITLYEWDWDNDGVFDENHTNPTAIHSWPFYGYYPVTLKVTDNSSKTGNKTKTVRVGNRPPEPPVIDGTSSRIPWCTYNYTFVTNDPDGDDVKYYIDWYSYGDGDWTDWYASGEEVILPHFWPEVGTFTISAMAKDRCGVESNWSYFDVEIPRNRASTYLWYQWFLDRYLILERLLNLLKWEFIYKAVN